MKKLIVTACIIFVVGMIFAAEEKSGYQRGVRWQLAERPLHGMRLCAQGVSSIGSAAYKKITEQTRDKQSGHDLVKFGLQASLMGTYYILPAACAITACAKTFQERAKVQITKRLLPLDALTYGLRKNVPLGLVAAALLANPYDEAVVGYIKNCFRGF